MKKSRFGPTRSDCNKEILPNGEDHNMNGRFSAHLFSKIKEMITLVIAENTPNTIMDEISRERTISVNLDGSKRRGTPKDEKTRRDPSRRGRDVTRVSTDVCDSWRRISQRFFYPPSKMIAEQF